MQTISPTKKSKVHKILLTWFEEMGRKNLPWRGTKDMYEITVSEIMLQQTNVPKVIEIYKAFLLKFPTVEVLAKARQSSVLRAWKGLGYNRRALNLHKMAKVITTDYRGIFPQNKEELLALPGIGPYTSSAVLVFSKNKNLAAIDVNIERVIRRLHGKQKWENEIQKEEIITGFLPLGQASNWHSALMDFASAICTKRTPKCEKCPLSKICIAYPDPKDYVAVKKKEIGRSENGKHIPRRIYRGRIIECLRSKAENTEIIGQKIKMDWSTLKDEKWLSEILDKLAKEGMIRQTGKKWRLQ